MFEHPVRDHDIAVIARAGRFPGARDVESFWANLRDGVESFVQISDEELQVSNVDPRLLTHPDYVKVRPVLDDIKGFDAGFFGYSPREAEIADPQQRLFLEVVWEALEQAGYGRADNRGRVGVWAGMNISMYMIDRFGDIEVLAAMDPYEVITGNEKDALATMVAYRLDLTGPAVSVQTFCSTSAAAVHMACQSLRKGECEMAVAGGVCVRVPDRVGHLYVEGGQVCPDGHVRTFDEQARGAIFGDGAGVVILKPLRNALADRDTIFAIIRGSAMNNDGASKFSYAAPSIIGQAAAVSEALADAEVSPRDVSYVEAHGTATELGDPIEVAALTRAFKSAELARSGEELRDRQYCAIGSVKTNIGHLDRAASVAGLIKVVEAFRHELIPESLHYHIPNPEIDFVRSPFYVAGRPVPWPAQPGRPRLAGLNGLGMGGTNVHIVLQEAPPPRERPESPRTWHVLPLSARSETAADQYRHLLGDHLAGTVGQLCADVAYTLQEGRALFAHRRACVTATTEAAATVLKGGAHPEATLMTRHDPSRGRRVAFVFAGVGEHYAGMVGRLYETEPVFRRHLDHVLREFARHSDLDLLAPLTTGRTVVADDLAVALGRVAGPTTALSETRLAQPAVFAAEYALAKTLLDWGVTPTLMVGYSLGEYVAACLAGVLSLGDAIRLVARRAELIAELPGGSMLAVGISWAELRAREPDLEGQRIDLAVVNPGQTVVAGPTAAVQELALRLRAAQIACRELDTTHAFHSSMLGPKAEELTAWVRESVTLNAPTSAFISNVTGEVADADLVTDPGYWARHMCRPVLFADGLAQLLRHQDMAVIEIGPGRSLGAMVRAHSDCDRARWPLVVSTLPAAAEDRGDDRTLAEAIGELWLTGVTFDWESYHRSEQEWAPGRVPLPTYPFQREEYWFNPSAGHRSQNEHAGEIDVDSLVDEYETLPLLPESQWMNLPVWRQRTPRPPVDGPDGDDWLIFTDDGSALGERLAAAVTKVTMVRPGERYEELPDGYRIRPGNSQDTLELLTSLRERSRVPSRVVHLWSMGGETAEQTVRRGAHTLVALVKAMLDVGAPPWKLDVVTAGVQQVIGSEVIRPERATVLGPCTIIPVECPGVTLRVIDLVEGEPLPIADLMAELGSQYGDHLVALRGGRRWVPDYEILQAPEMVAEPVTSIRPGGVYLITGGLGGLGLAMAERLVKHYQARLVLMGRTVMPPPERWETILADPAASDEVRRRVQALAGLTAMGADVVVVAGDVARQADVERAIVTAKERFGELHGVLHAAGVPGMGMMQFKTMQDIDLVLAPKVAGTLALANTLKDEKLDFLLLFSSVSSVTGALGQADYSAANAFLDAFAQAQPLPQTRVISVGWGEWTWNGWEAGLDGYEPVIADFYRLHRERFGIGFEEGWRSLLRVLARPEPYVVVSTQDFSAQVEGSRNYTIEDVQTAAKRGRGDARHARPDLSTPYMAPQSHAELVIAEIWAEALGVDQVGVNDNFFDLGGNSLTGVGIVAAIRQVLELDRLPAHIIYQCPTVGTLAASVTAPTAGSTAESADAGGRAEERAKQRRQRIARRRNAAQDGADDE
ncbi:SDR family NAD(P)-dependent oxidoreductase [Nonomuraea sp. NPDC049695]|uniref:type I polyketide synthase n=1 Tax=Nonomuraea sp. NPDC049695 TaxID=3154734 RepID=UPI00341EFBA8